MGKHFLIVVATKFWSLLIDQFVRHISDWFGLPLPYPLAIHTHICLCGSVLVCVGVEECVWVGVVALGSASFLLLLRIFICFAACFLFLFFSVSFSSFAVNQNSSINWQKLPRRGANVASCCCRSLSRCCCCCLELIAELANLARGASVEFMFAFLSHANSKQHRGVSSSSRGRGRGGGGWLRLHHFCPAVRFFGVVLCCLRFVGRAHKIHKLKCSQIDTPPFPTPPPGLAMPSSVISVSICKYKVSCQGCHSAAGCWSCLMAVKTQA